MARKPKMDDVLDDTPRKQAKKAAAKEVVGTGRPASPETLAARKRILQLARKGISNPALAEKLDVTTMKSQSLAKSLVDQGLLKVEKVDNRVFYTTIAA